MAGALDRALAGMDEKDARQPATDPETAEALGALGYVQGPGGRGSGADPKDKVAVARMIARASGPFRDQAAAADAYRAIAAKDPDNPLVNFRLADALLRSGRPREAIPLFRRVVAGEPRTADPFVGLAAAYADIERLDEAGRVLEAALAVDPRNGQVRYNLGEIARARGDRARARGFYESALDDPVTRERAQARLDALR
jgi:Flp pilus assembly protein TadD